MNINKGDIVTIINNTIFSQLPSFSLYSWSGKVEKVIITLNLKTLVSIIFDSSTISKMPNEYISLCKTKGLDHTRAIISSNSLMIVQK